ncbi:THAP-type domain-containing protein [Trichonephila clavipes]|nr:THAP-type domain-containing protein [Trichonephila clavipes]
MTLKVRKYKAVKVCELHFSDDAIQRYTEAYNEKTGEKICVPLKRYRLHDFDVPTIFTDFPTYLSNSGNPTRECPEKRLQRLENEHLQRSIQASIISKEEFEKKKSFTSFPEIVECLNAEKLQDIWSVICKNDLVIIMMLDTKISPVIKASVIINKDLDLTIHIGQTKIDQLGMAYNSEQAATSAYVFMIQSLLSPFKEVVPIMPVKKIDGEKLFAVVKKTIVELDGIGFKVIDVVSDNNSINRKAMSDFSVPPKLSIVYPHPSDSSNHLFFVIDSVHIFKCIQSSVLHNFNITLSEKDFSDAQPYLPVLTYLAGVCARATLKKLKCDFCSKSLVLNKSFELNSNYDLIRNLDRGSLLCPSPDVATAVLYNYILVQKPLSNDYENMFLKQNNQRQIASEISISLINSNEFFLYDEPCNKNDHSSELVLKHIIITSTNALLNNYCKGKNDIKKVETKKRKMYTLLAK